MTCRLKPTRSRASAFKAALFIFIFAAMAFARPALAIETIAKAAILVEMDTGAVLFEKNADELLTPASMSKMMTVYMIFDRLRNGSLSLDDTFPVSERAWRNGGARSGSSTMFLEPGQRVRVEDLIQGDRKSVV